MINKLSLYYEILKESIYLNPMSKHVQKFYATLYCKKKEF